MTPKLKMADADVHVKLKMADHDVHVKVFISLNYKQWSLYLPSQESVDYVY